MDWNDFQYYVRCDAPEDLVKAEGLWLTYRSKNRGRAVSPERLITCFEFVEVLGRELAKLAFSFRAHDLPINLVRDYHPKERRDWGTESFLLRKLGGEYPICNLMSSRPDDESVLVPMGHIERQINRYLKKKEPSEVDAIFSAQITSKQKPHRTWYEAFEGFRRIRNLYVHPTAQGATAENVSPKLKDPNFLRHITFPLEKWAEWLASAALQVLLRFRVLHRVEETESSTSFNCGNDSSALISLPSEHSNPFNVSVECRDLWFVEFDETGEFPIRALPRIDRPQLAEDVLRDCWVKSARRSDIFDAATEGTLMAVVGNEFGYPNRPNALGASHVILRAGKALSDPRFSGLKPFLRQLIQQRLRLVEPPSLGGVTVYEGDRKAELVGHLATLAAEATGLFGTALATKKFPVANSTNLILDKTEQEEFCDLIDDAVAKTERLDRGRYTHDQLGLPGIIQGLDSLRSEVHRSHCLQLTQVDWLTDLAWHALRWDAPFYPDSESMALQLALFAASQDGETPRIPRSRAPASCGSALIIGREAYRRYLSDWIKFIRGRIQEDSRRKRRADWGADVHSILANAMKRCLDARNPVHADIEEETDIDLEDDFGFDDGAFFNDDDGVSLVWIVDASLDQRMIDALAQNTIPHSVVFPISVNEQPAWGVRHAADNDSTLEKFDILFHAVNAMETRTLTVSDHPRIIVIKPFGAPCEETHHLDNVLSVLAKTHQTWLDSLRTTDGSLSIQPRLLVDDISIIKDVIRHEDSLPPGFRYEVLRGIPRGTGTIPWKLFFLGYPLDEHGSRTRIIADVLPLNKPTGSEKDPERYYLSDPSPGGLDFHYLTRAGFKNFRIKHLYEPMWDLAAQLANEIPSS